MTRSDTIQEIFSHMSSLKRYMQQQFHANSATANLSPAQFEALTAVHRLEPISHKLLAKEMQLTPGALSQLLDALDQAQCIVRTASPTDRRVSYVALSRQGKAMLEQINKHRKQFFTDIFSVMTDEELEVYSQVQLKMINWFESHALADKKESL